MLQVLVVSPYPTVRVGLRAILEASGDISVGWAAEGVMDLEGPWPLRPDVALVDDAAGAAVVEALESAAPDLAVVLLGENQARNRREWSAAPRGYLTRDAPADEIVAAVRTVAQGLTVMDPSIVRGLLGAGVPARLEQGAVAEERLTPRELEVIHLLAAGLPNKTIAVRLGISEHTAKFHVSSVLSKLGASSRTEAVTLAARRGLLLL